MRQREIKGNLPMNILHRLQEAALEEEENLQIVMVTGHNLSLTRTLKILAWKLYKFSYASVFFLV